MSNAITALLVECAWKGAALLTLGLAGTCLLARDSAAARRWVLVATMLGLLLLPAASPTLQQFGLILPVEYERVEAVTATGTGAPGAGNDLRLQENASTIGNNAAQETGANPSNLSRLVAMAGPDLESGPRDEFQEITPTLQRDESHSVSFWLAVAWFSGCVVMMVPILAGTYVVRRLERSAADVTLNPLGARVARVAAELGIRRPITTLVTAERSIPMTWGVLRPRVLLPRESQSWTSARLQMVLLHELTHIRRCDCMALWTGQLARAVHWFNPLAWWGLHRLHVELENSCDDEVLASGTDPADYAEELVEITSGLPRSAWAASVALAVGRNHRIRCRLEAILDDKRNRRSLPGRSIGRLAACGLAFTLGVGALQFREAAAINSSSIQPVEVRSASRVRSEVELASAEPSPEVLSAAGAGTAEPGSKLAKSDQPQAALSSPLSQKSLAEIQALIKSRYARPADEHALTESAINGMLKSLNDPYTEYMSPERLGELYMALDGSLTGIGVQVSMEEGRMTVLTALPDSPALQAGLRPGDVVLAVDGKSVEETGVPVAIAAIRGIAGTTVKLKLRRAGGNEEELAIPRKAISPTSVQGIAISPAGQWQYWIDEGKKIGYVQITEFNKHTADAFRKTVESLQEAGLKGLLLDLRQCPGGLLDAAVDVARSLLPEAVIVSVRGQSDPEHVYRSTGEGALTQFPLIVVVNEHTASAAEVLSAALRDNGRAVILGTRTYGKGSVQSIFNVGDAGAVRLTTAYFYSPKGGVIDRQPESASWGVDPNDGMYVPVSADRFVKWSKAHKLRSVIDPSRPGNKVSVETFSPERVEKDLADPQLAAALRSMTAKVVEGEFARVGQSEASLQAHYLLRDRLRSLQKQHDDMLKQMEKINKELQSVEQ